MPLLSRQRPNVYGRSARRALHIANGLAARGFAVLDQPKWGFGIPLQQWLEGPLRDLVGYLVDAGAFAPPLEPEGVRRVVRAFYARRGANVGQVWALLSLRLWLDATVERRSTAAAAIA